MKKFINRILSGILVLLGFSACDKENNEPENILIMYGTPTASYKISGKAMDKNSTGISNIQVIVKEKRYNSQYYHPGDTLTTNEKGIFYYEGYGISPEQDCRVIFHDIDGEANGGTFQSNSVDIKTEKIEEGKGWDRGKGSATIEIILKQTSTQSARDKE